MKEYIEREAAEEALLLGMVMTGYQSRAIDCVHYLPAADVREVVMGEWVAHEAYRGATWCFWECSVCGDKSWTIKHNFCPNCGADMREPEKEVE